MLFNPAKFRDVFVCLLLVLAPFRGWSQVEGDWVVWQLTLEVEADGALRILEAQVAPGAKRGAWVEEVAVGGEMLEWEWLDERMEAVFVTSANVQAGIRLPLNLEGSNREGWIFGEASVVVCRVLGPRRRELVVGARVKPLERGSRVLSESQFLPLPEERVGLFNEEEQEGPIGSYKFVDTGPDMERLVFVVVGDGYLREDIESGKYREDVEKTFEAFEDVSPWDDLLNAVNIYVVDVVSKERGASKEDGEDGTIKDTYFGTAFYHGGTKRLLYPQGDGVQLGRAAADEAVGVGVWDQIVMIVNSSEYGGSGGSISVHSMHRSGPAISVHEVGHSYGGLADEYHYSDDAEWTGSRPRAVNLDTKLDDLKWKEWLEPGVPLPTDGEPGWNDAVGAFEGGGYKEFGVYRPQRRCNMKSLSDPFCKVCRERLVQRFYQLTDSSVGFTTTPSRGNPVTVGAEREFSFSPPDLEGNRLLWYFDDVLIDEADGAAFVLSRERLTGQSHTLGVEWGYDEEVVRRGDFQRWEWEVVPAEETEGGVPYWWLETFGLEAELGVDEKDYDADGFTTAEEYVANTDPTSWEKRLALVRWPSREGAPWGSLVWAMASGRRYTLEHSENLRDWVAVPGYEGVESPLPGVGNYAIPKEGSVGYYRIRVEFGSDQVVSEEMLR